VNAEELVDRGVAAGQANRFDEAERFFRAAIEVDPNHPRAHLNLAVACQALLKLDDALHAARRAIELSPNESNPHQALGRIFMSLNHVPEAIEAYRRALAIAPDDPESHGLLARALLISGDFKRGWAEYEWRWKCASFREVPRQFPQARWNGARADGKTVLLYHEQGYGDTIQFVRYAPLAAERCEAVIVQVPPDMIGLVRRMPGIDQVVALGGELPPFDLHAALLSLPLLFNTTIKTIPAKVPYLFGSGAAAELWKSRLREDGAKLRVGLTWAGRPSHPNDPRRSIALSELAPLGSVEGVVFYSLQKGDFPRDPASPPMRMIDCAGKLNDFSDTAALIHNLDLVISVDTAVAHLAGAMGKPVWTFLPFAADFRWLLDRTDTPWYPTMTLLRQKEPGVWGEVVDETVARLKERVGQHPTQVR
jgi:hypothetical protein